jgi:hypothetical protein
MISNTGQLRDMPWTFLKETERAGIKTLTNTRDAEFTNELQHIRADTGQHTTRMQQRNEQI